MLINYIEYLRSTKYVWILISDLNITLKLYICKYTLFLFVI